MKIGTRVTYVDSAGEKHDATVTEVGPRGPSGSRTVDLTLDDGGKRSDVPHAADGKGTRTYWIEATPPPVERAAEPVHPPTRGADYVYGEGEATDAPDTAGTPLPLTGPGDVTPLDDDGPGLGGGGGGTPVTPPDGTEADIGTAGADTADVGSTGRTTRRK